MRVKYIDATLGRVRIAAVGTTVTVDINDGREAYWEFPHEVDADNFVASLNQDNIEKRGDRMFRKKLLDLWMTGMFHAATQPQWEREIDEKITEVLYGK